MNKFTKEELLVLLEYMDYPIEEIYGTQGNRLSIVCKIQAMIEDFNDCKHDGEIGIDYPAEKCMQCGVCLGW